MVCAQLGAEKVVLTDYVDGVLRNTQKNVDANNCEGRAIVAMLDWLHPETFAAFDSASSNTTSNSVGDSAGIGDSCSGGMNGGTDGETGGVHLLAGGGFDTVIAADVIYDEWHAEAVPKMCAQFMRRPSPDGSGAHPDAIATQPDAIRCLVVLGDRTCLHPATIPRTTLVPPSLVPSRVLPLVLGNRTCLCLNAACLGYLESV